jgi:hypothetical protein
MTKSKLFLLKPGFADPAIDDGVFFCPECAQVEGLLGYFPQLREMLEVTYVAFQRPRPEIVRLIGDMNQSCPVLVSERTPDDGMAAAPASTSKYSIIQGATAISGYLAGKYSTARPHP